MLQNLFIKNFMLIDSLTIDFQNGLNILTGETGSGKSIIINALQLALGGRATGGLIRTGSEKALVQAAFDISQNKSIISLLEEQGIEPPEDNVLIMSREINLSGKNTCRLNGQVVTLNFYRHTGRCLVDLHVQHEQHSLLEGDRHRYLLDRFGGLPLFEAKTAVEAAYTRWEETLDTFEQLRNSAEERTQQAELLRYQINEIEQVDPKAGEDNQLLAEKKLLVNAEKIKLLASESYTLLYEGSQGHYSVTDLLSRSLESVKSLVLIDERLEPVRETLESVLYQVEDGARELANFSDRVEHNPQRLEAVEDRLAVLGRLKKRYNRDLQEILDYLDFARGEIEQLDSGAEQAEAIGEKLKIFKEAYHSAALKLSAARRMAAKKLETEVSRELASLEMERVEFQVAFTELDRPSRTGAERIEFLISPNPGEPLKPLAKIASGGELSRLMLTLKALLANVDDIPVLIFDEVDSGIGGLTLHAVAEKLAKISDTRQVVCVTHAAQIAGYANAHHRVSKELAENRTVTKVETLDLSGRVEELAKMLGGKEVTEITRCHAGQLLRRARSID
ncbi:MAG: DNA repair protein RecN [Pelotomaculum sp. PtaB.Bin104]|nr:MAG: DNA repair protein RecN [Pelotomaculum sp. PtaB.Bin104]